MTNEEFNRMIGHPNLSPEHLKAQLGALVDNVLSDEGRNYVREILLASIADRERLRRLIAQAEFALEMHECPWCHYGAVRDAHASDCPAFSAPGVVR